MDHPGRVGGRWQDGQPDRHAQLPQLPTRGRRAAAAAAGAAAYLHPAGEVMRHAHWHSV